MRTAAGAIDALADVVPDIHDALAGDHGLMSIGVSIVPLATAPTEWSSSPTGVDGEAVDAGDVESDIEESGVSGVLGEEDEDGTLPVGGGPSRTGMGGGIDFEGKLAGGCCELAAKEGMSAMAPVCTLYGVVDGMGDGAGEGMTYVGYGPGPLKSRRTFVSNSFNAFGSMFSCHSRYEHISRSIWLISLRANIS